MPYRPASECPHPGCKVLVPGGGRCEEHKRTADREHVDRVWGERTRLHGTSRWRKYSAERLRVHRWCVLCLEAGRGMVPATTTDHIKSARRFPDLFWDPENHRSLCRTCNYREEEQSR